MEKCLSKLFSEINIVDLNRHFHSIDLFFLSQTCKHLSEIKKEFEKKLRSFPLENVSKDRSFMKCITHGYFFLASTLYKEKFDQVLKLPYEIFVDTKYHVLLNPPFEKRDLQVQTKMVQDFIWKKQKTLQSIIGLAACHQNYQLIHFLFNVTPNLVYQFENEDDHKTHPHFFSSEIFPQLLTNYGMFGKWLAYVLKSPETHITKFKGSLPFIIPHLNLDTRKRLILALQKQGYILSFCQDLFDFKMLDDIEFINLVDVGLFTCLCEIFISDLEFNKLYLLLDSPSNHRQELITCAFNYLVNNSQNTHMVDQFLKKYQPKEKVALKLSTYLCSNSAFRESLTKSNLVDVDPFNDRIMEFTYFLTRMNIKLDNLKLLSKDQLAALSALPLLNVFSYGYNYEGIEWVLKNMAFQNIQHFVESFLVNGYSEIIEYIATSNILTNFCKTLVKSTSLLVAVVLSDDDQAYNVIKKFHKSAGMTKPLFEGIQVMEFNDNGTILSNWSFAKLKQEGYFTSSVLEQSSRLLWDAHLTSKTPPINTTMIFNECIRQKVEGYEYCSVVDNK